MGSERSLHVLTGSTASGKTEWALRWAEKYRAEIISCDSLLFYRGMDIGTAKPTAEERSRVPHHLIDSLDVTERMNVASYVRSAKKAAEDIASRGRPILVAGGSGFYLKAFFAPVADTVEVAPEIREGVAARLRAEGLPGLTAELRRLNPDGLGNLDLANPRRVARALERSIASGKTFAQLSREFAAMPPPFAQWRVSLVRLERDPEELRGRIEARTAGMLKKGLVDEVRGLLAAGIKSNPSAAGAIGYRETIATLEGRLPPSELEGEIIKATRALVKKQRTWFRTQLPSHRSVAAALVREPAELFPL